MNAHAELDLSVTDTPKTGLLGAVQSGLDVINGLLAILSALAIFAAGLVLTWEVIGRYALGIASDWQDELSTFLLVGATFASAAWTQASEMSSSSAYHATPFHPWLVPPCRSQGF